MNNLILQSNPYPGLRPFDLEDQHLFFGRDGKENEMLRILRKHHFLAVVGASGTGKSSLVRCGLISALHQGFLIPEINDWKIALFRPGNDPIGKLTDALVSGDSLEKHDLDAETMEVLTAVNLRRTSQGLCEVYKYAELPEGTGLLLVVDQWEELFRFHNSASRKDAAHFVRLLIQASENKELPIYVVMTVRSDFIGECTRFRGLPEVINKTKFLIPRMDREELKAVVVRPVKVMGGEIRPRLVQRVLRDVGENPDHLPVMQHALMRTWERWEGDHEVDEPLDLRHYEGVGGMEEALSRHAEEAWCELKDDRERSIAETLFKALTQKEKGDIGIRRPSSAGKICDLANCNLNELVAVVEVFRQEGRAFLMPHVGKEIGEETVVDISHESLMRIWKRLQAWVEEEAESAEFYDRLAETAFLHSDGKVGFLQDPELQLALNWKEEQAPTETWGNQYRSGFEAVMLFLESSRNAHEAAIALKEKARRKELKRTRIFALIFGVLALLAIGFLVFAMQEKERAEQGEEKARISEVKAGLARREAECNELDALSNAELAQQAKLKAEDQQRIAEWNAKEALRQERIAIEERTQAMEARTRAEKSEENALTQKQLAVNHAQEAELQKDLAKTAENETYRISMLTIARALAIRSSQEEKIEKGLYALQALNFHQEYGGKRHDPDIYAGILEAKKALSGPDFNALKGHSQPVNSAAFSPDGQTLASAGSDGKVILWDLNSNEKSGREVYTGWQFYRDIIFSPDGRWMLFLGNGAEIYVCDLNSDEKRVYRHETESRVRTYAFSPDGNHLIYGGTDWNLRVLEVSSREVVQRFSLPEEPAEFSIDEDGNSLVFCTFPGRVYQLEIENDRIQSPLTLEPIYENLINPATTVDISPAGHLMAWGTRSGELMVWDTTADTLLNAIPGKDSESSQVQFSPDGNWFAASSLDQSVRIWRSDKLDDRPVQLSGHKDWVHELAFSPDNTELVTVSRDSDLRIWPISVNGLGEGLCELVGRNFSRKEWNEMIGETVPYEMTCLNSPGPKPTEP